MNIFRRNAPFTVLPLVLLCAPMTHAGETEDAIEYRQAIMGVLSWNTDKMAAMVKGEVPFDSTAFSAYAKDLSATASLNILAGFPDDSVSEESDAKDEIWLDWSDFESKLQELRTQSAKLAEVTESGDESAIKTQFDETRGACKACHKAYKK